MARHSTGKNNYAISKGLIALLIALALLIAAVVFWLVERNSTDADLEARNEQPECVSGDLALPVAATTERVAQELIGNYANSQPVVRDYCVRPVFVDNLDQAALYIAPNTPISHQAIGNAGRNATTNEPPSVYSSRVGIAGAAATDANSTDLKQIVFPTGDQPEASAVVASTIAIDDQLAISALTDQRVSSTSEAALNSTRFLATADNALPEGFVFSPLDNATVVYSAIPLNTTDAVSEDQTRAAQAFADYAGEQFAGEEALPVLAESVWAAARPHGGEAITDNPDLNADAEQHVAPVEPMRTLFVLDSSDGMAAYADAAKAGINEATARLIADGHDVALWNYSSPLSPGATKGYRKNLEFAFDPGDVADQLNRFTNAGQPQTREAIAAAIDYAAPVADAAQPVRIVLITSGTVDGGGDIAGAIRSAQDNGVQLSVVHIGPEGKDMDLTSAAAHASDAVDAGAVEPAVLRASGY